MEQMNVRTKAQKWAKKQTKKMAKNRERNTHLQMNKNVINSKCLRLIKIMIITAESTKKKPNISGSLRVKQLKFQLHTPYIPLLSCQQ